MWTLSLQQQHLIELIRLRETESALEFAQTQLAEQGEESRECLTEMERTLALLAFDNPEESPFGDLLNMMQRQKVRTDLLFCFTSLFHLDMWVAKQMWDMASDFRTLSHLYFGSFCSNQGKKNIYIGFLSL